MLIDQKPFSSPFNRCKRQPGISSCVESLASLSAPNTHRNFSRWCGWIPLALPDRKKRSRPLCWKEMITTGLYRIAIHSANGKKTWMQRLYGWGTPLHDYSEIYAMKQLSDRELVDLIDCCYVFLVEEESGEGTTASGISCSLAQRCQYCVDCCEKKRLSDSTVNAVCDAVCTRAAKCGSSAASAIQPSLAR